MIKIAIVEDSTEYRNTLISFLEKYEVEREISIVPKIFATADQFLEEFENDYDIVLMDIEMPGTNGMDAAKQMRAHGSEVVIMFITNLAHYAIKGYEVGAMDFVLKPIEYFNFAIKMDRAVQLAENRENKTIMVQTATGIVKINVRDIYYLEIQNHVLSYHTASGVYKVRGSLKNAEEVLPGGLFAKCSNWCLVGLAHVQEIREDNVIVHEEELPISRRSKKTFMAALTKSMGRI